MIAGFRNLQSFNDGHGNKSVSVVAAEDAAGGMETLTFVIFNQTVTTQVNFTPNQMQTVTVRHTASSGGTEVLVQVSAANSTQTLNALLDIDKVPGDS
jgi:hypothetical protein